LIEERKGHRVRIAALYDIHANLPALEAVLHDVRRAGVDRIVVGGDVVPGPMPRETLARLGSLDLPVQFIQGNGELAVLAQLDATDTASIPYWGTTSGAAPPEPVREILRWTAEQIRHDSAPLRQWPKTCRRSIDGLGDVLFCHGTPRSETECFTRLTAEAPLAPVFTASGATVVVCGHTHMQFDRLIAGVRVINAGSVGMPFGEVGAYWLVLGPDVELRRTAYDLQRAATRIRATTYPQAAEFAEGSVLQPPTEAAMLEAFTRASFR
jgi:predicted phosphodiesterase